MNTEFSARFAKSESELKWLYMQLYHGNGDAWQRLLSVMEQAMAERDPALKALDREREADRSWYRSRMMTGVELYADRFGGTLQGMKKHIAYLHGTGAAILHIMPLLKSPADRSDGGYAVSDYRTVQPELGTMKDVEELCTDCHTHGMLVCLDFPMNHVSEDHEWVRRAKAGEKEYQNRFYMFDSWDIPNVYEQNKPQVFPTTAPGNFTWCPEANKAVMTTFYPYEWDLNYANPDVFNDMTANLLYLFNRGTDVMRLCTLPFLWKELRTSCCNLPQVHTIVRMLRIITETVCPGVLLLGDVVLPPEQAMDYFGTLQKPECHLLENATVAASVWNAVATHDARHLAHQLKRLFSLSHDCTFANFLRNHDDLAWVLDYDYLRSLGMEEGAHRRFLNDWFTGAWQGSPARGERYNTDPSQQDARLCGTTASLCGLETALHSGDEKAIDRAVRLILTLHAFINTLSGIPMGYSGDEIGQTNDEGYRNNPARAADGRYLHRPVMDWEKAARASDPTTVEGRIYSGIAGLNDIHSTHHVFDLDADTWIGPTGNDSVLAIGRYLYGESLSALFNFSDEDQTVHLARPETCTDLLTGEKENLGTVTVPARGFRWLQATYYEF